MPKDIATINLDFYKRKNQKKKENKNDLCGNSSLFHEYLDQFPE
jgi:hypothetical protein